MGNRAVITHSKARSAPAIYLHWNGGRASVEAFLAYARDAHIGGTSRQRLDRLAEDLARGFFKTKVGMTVYREPYGQTDADNGDNGTYVIDTDWRITERLFMRGGEEINADKTAEIRTALAWSTT